jgi:hypothetical protein
MKKEMSWIALSVVAFGLVYLLKVQSGDSQVSAGMAQPETRSELQKMESQVDRIVKRTRSISSIRMKAAQPF